MFKQKKTKLGLRISMLQIWPMKIAWNMDFPSNNQSNVPDQLYEIHVLKLSNKSQILGIVLKLDYSSCEIITVTELFFANHFW